MLFGDVFDNLGKLEVGTGGGGGGSSILKGASTGATAGSIIPGLGTLVGGVIGAFSSFFSGIKGKTPRLNYDQYLPIAEQFAREVSAALSPYARDASFLSALRDAAVSFVQTNNPGQSRERGMFMDNIINKSGDVYGYIVQPTLYSLSGTSSNPDDPTGPTWRVNEVMVKVIAPVVNAYERKNGIASSSVASAFTGASSAGPATAEGGSFMKNPLYIVAGLVLGVVLVVVLVFGRGKA